ncbi:MAG: lysophospholipase [Bacteroidetes bacterium HGW-Bacteroidetes-15]|nr:MAG: lysophospholipase [Bacteroidetes bacterium HGW-Bacteroidetes-15]
MKALSLILTITIIIHTLGCKSEEMDPSIPLQISYLALGDSYTIGQGVPEHDRYPVQLQDSLRNAGITIDNIQIIAQTGWTTSQLSTNIDNVTQAPPYNLVTLLIGVNNQYRGLGIEDYRDEFATLLSRAIGFAGNDKSKVIVLSIPDWGVTPFAEGRDREKIAMEIDAFNAVNFDEVQKAGVAYVDVTPISREAANRPELIATDNLHPSGLMYSYWVDDLFPIAFEILKNQQ